MRRASLAPSSTETQAQLDGSGLDVMDYDSRWGRYRIRLAKGDTTKHRDFLAALMTKAFQAITDFHAASGLSNVGSRRADSEGG